MKSLTSTAQAHSQSKYNEPVLLLEIDWSDIETGRYADRSIQVEGIEYSGIVVDAAPIEYVYDDPASEVGPVTVRLVPEDELTDRLSVDSVEGKTVRVKLAFAGTEAADAIELFSGHIERLDFVKSDCLELTATGFFRKHNCLLPRNVISADDLPKAHADEIGKPMPIVFGEVTEVPALKVKTGGITHLRGSILSDDTTIEVDDTSAFPASGTLLIEEEQIAYAGVSDNIFTGCTRGVNETEAAEHLNRREVIEYLTEHIFLVAGHPCKAIENIKIGGVPVEEGACTVNGNNTSLVSGLSLTTVTFINRPKVRRYSAASRFLEMQFDETATGNEATNPQHCYDVSLEGFATLVAMLSGSSGNDTLRVKQTTDVSGHGEKYGEIMKVFLLVEHFESTPFVDDFLSVHVAGETYALAGPSAEDTAGGDGEVDIDHGHTHAITGEHTHSLAVKKQPIFVTNVVQAGGTTGSWSDLDEIAGENLNKSGFTTTTTTDRSLQCNVETTTVKGAVEQVQLCCRRGESGMAGSFVLRFYLNGDLEKQYTVSGTSSPETWKSGWETISGLEWGDIDNSNTYITITPLGGALIRLFGVWYEVKYLEQPDSYQGDGVKDEEDVNDHTGANAHVINEDPISSTSVVEATDITELVAGDWSWFNAREVRVDYNVVGSDDGVAGYVLHVWFEVEYAPFEEIVSDELTCTVQGLESAGDGTGELLENPADAIKHFLVSLPGIDEGTHVDTASFDAAREDLAGIGARFGFALTGRTWASGLLQGLAEQGRCRLKYDSGKYQLIYRPDSPGSPVRSVTSFTTLSGSSNVRRSGLNGIVNKAAGYHTRDYLKQGSVAERYSGFIIAENTSSQETFGTREWELELSYVRDPSYAQTLLDFLVARRAEPRRNYSWKSFLRDVDLERGDIVEISDLEMDLLRVKGEITRSSFLPGSGIRKQTDTFGFTAELEAYAMHWSVPGSTYIRLVDGSFYFVVQRELVSRLAADGTLFIKGFVVGDQELPSCPDYPIGFVTDRRAIAFSLTDTTCLMEIDHDGNVLLPADVMEDQDTLPTGGTPDSIESDAAKVWFNVGTARAAEVLSNGFLRLPKFIVENAEWEQLLG